MELKTNNMQRPTPAIKVTREQISQTKAFKNASKLRQGITLNRTNFKWIEHGVNVATNIGFEKWDKQTQATFANREIIQELISQ